MSLRLMGQLPLRIPSLGRSSHCSGDKVPAVKYGDEMCCTMARCCSRAPGKPPADLPGTRIPHVNNNNAPVTPFFHEMLLLESQPVFKAWISTSKHRLEDRLGQPSLPPVSTVEITQRSAAILCLAAGLK